LYVVTLLVANKEEGSFNRFSETLRGMGGKPVMREYSWLLESAETAAELYVQLAPLLEEEEYRTNKLLIAEITANSAGTHIGRRDLDLTRLLAKARRV
jgi:hypothetical protein